MTSEKVRYFMRDDGLQVVADPDPDLSWYEHKAATEVQVVPLDAIVIRRDELPEVVPGRDGGEYVTIDGHIYGTAALPGYRDDRAAALRRLALIEYLREHPPVDEAQVKALNDIYEDWSQPHNYGVSFGQYLVERGVRVEQP